MLKVINPAVGGDVQGLWWRTSRAVIARCNSAPLRARSPPARARRRRPRPKGRRNHSLYQAGIRLYSLVADGVLDHAEVQDGLLTAADAARLLDEEPLQTRRTLASAERTGLAHPAASHQRPSTPPWSSASLPGATNQTP